MGFPGYYLVNPADLHTFTLKERSGSDPKSIEELDIVHETDSGKKFVFKQGSRASRKYVFRGTSAQMEQFEDLHILVGGQETAFYFVADVAAMLAVYVRKEKDFKPSELDQRAVVDGVETDMYDYTLELTEEPEAGSFGE